MASVSQTQILHFYSIQNEISTFHVEMIFILILNTAQLRTCSGTQVGLKKTLNCSKDCSVGQSILISFKDESLPFICMGA